MPYDNKKMSSHSYGDIDPNAGENQVHYSGNTEGGRTASVIDSSGIEYGLSEVSSMPVKNGEPMVTRSQRPESYRKKIKGGFVCGT